MCACRKPRSRCAASACALLTASSRQTPFTCPVPQIPIPLPSEADPTWRVREVRSCRELAYGMNDTAVDLVLLKRDGLFNCTEADWPGQASCSAGLPGPPARHARFRKSWLPAHAGAGDHTSQSQQLRGCVGAAQLARWQAITPRAQIAVCTAKLRHVLQHPHLITHHQVLWPPCRLSLITAPSMSGGRDLTRSG